MSKVGAMNMRSAICWGLLAVSLVSCGSEDTEATTAWDFTIDDLVCSVVADGSPVTSETDIEITLVNNSDTEATAQIVPLGADQPVQAEPTANPAFSIVVPPGETVVETTKLDSGTYQPSCPENDAAIFGKLTVTQPG